MLRNTIIEKHLITVQEPEYFQGEKRKRTVICRIIN